MLCATCCHVSRIGARLIDHDGTLVCSTCRSLLLMGYGIGEAIDIHARACPSLLCQELKTEGMAAAHDYRPE